MSTNCQDSNGNLEARIEEAIQLPPFTLGEAEKLRALLRDILSLLKNRVGCRCCGKEVW